jgi:hypothetical protein
MMTLTPSESRPWWKEPMIWLIIGLPTAAVIASFASYFIAAHEPDSMVKSEYRKEGFAVVAPITAADQTATTLGLTARLTTREGQLEVALLGNLAAAPKRLTLNIVHPTLENQDLHILLAHSHELSYIAPAPVLGSGKRILVLEPEDRAWRITGQWLAPFSGMTELVAETSKSSTHP